MKYDQSANYDFTSHHPSFILIDGGVYQILFNYGDLGDSKRWLEGKGKALQFKHVNSVGMHWVGVPIIMTATEYHEYVSSETFLRNSYWSEFDEQRCIQQESHRRAFLNRINIVELKTSRFPHERNRF